MRSMDVFNALRLARRWWLLFLTVVIVLAVPLLSMLETGVQPEFRAQATILFSGPTERLSKVDPGEFEAVNPLTNQPSSLETVVVVSSIALETADVAELLASEGLSADYRSEPVERSPLLTLEARAGSRETATDTVVRLTELIDDDIRVRQGAAVDAPTPEVTTRVLGISTSGGSNQRSARRIQALTVVFVLLCGLAVCGLAERLAGRSPRAYAVPGVGSDAKSVSS